VFLIEGASAMKDYYKILGVSSKASDDEIKKAFRKLAREHHPDANPNNKASEAKFKEFSEAYETLGDSEKRKQYDAMRANPFAGAGGPGGFGRQAGHGPGGFSGGSANFSGLDDILGTLFRHAGGSQGGRGPKGQDVEVEAEVSLEDVVKGTTVTLAVSQPDGSAKRLKVSIPAGVATGAKVRVSGEGEPGVGGRGDLLVKVKVKPHARFTREGDDLHVDLPVSVFDAVLGAEVTAPTMDGEIKLKIPAGSQGGKVFRLKERGVPHLKGGGRGALLIKLQLQIPTAIPEADLPLWRQLAQREAPVG
jgi:DnaJ-class molecular chaperone